MRTAGDSSRAFAGWCVAGAAGCLGTLTLLTIGPFVLLGTLFLCAWLLSRFNFGWAMGGLLSGAALPLLYVAWLNRDGPGNVCSRNGSGITCTDEWSPWPIVGVAVLLLLAGLVVLARRRRE
jgi:MYXO-CTERM domain-containing protein